MYAVIKSGGKQYRIKEGDTLKLETLPQEVGATVDFEDVLMVGDGESAKVGSPFVKGSKVSAKVVSHGRHHKVRIVKFKRRKHHMKWQGHRQNYTEVEITKIKA